MEESDYDVLVIGGGIAGLAVAYHLLRMEPKGLRLALCEQEPWLAAHSSARNAAMFRHLDNSAPIGFSIRSCELWDELLNSSSSPWLKKTGAVYIAEQAAPLQDMVDQAQQAGVSWQLLDRSALVDMVPPLADSPVSYGLHVENDGVMDIHLMAQKLATEIRWLGGVIKTSTKVTSLEMAAGRLTGVGLANGSSLRTDTLVVAAGAWSG
jgi:glycine/D-amino acid oxidase-like deaminating enzyme